MNKDPQVFLKHILESINDIEQYTKSLTEKSFLQKKYMQDAVVRRIEIIGEAARNLPDELTIKYPEVPWKDIIGMRNKVIHHYFGVDIKVTWEVIQKDIPVLKEKIKKIVENM